MNLEPVHAEMQPALPSSSTLIRPIHLLNVHLPNPFFMSKIYYLETCKTCQRILKELEPGPEVELQEIKSTPIRAEQLDALKERAGSYEALFSRRAMKYRSMGLNEQSLSEEDYRRYLLEEYTFLKRPVVLVDDEVFIGSAKKVVAAAKERLHA